MLILPSIIVCVLARIYDLLRRVFLGDLDLDFEFLLDLTDEEALVGLLSLSLARLIHSLYISSARLFFSASFSIASNNLARAICRVTAFFILCIFFLRVLLFTSKGGGFCEADSTSSAAFLAALAAGVFGIPSFSKRSDAYRDFDIVLYKGCDN